jgi:hypothetical protein
MHEGAVIVAGENSSNESMKSRLIGLAGFVIFLPVYFGFRHFNREGLGLLIVSISGVFFAAAYVNSEHLRSVKFISLLSLFYIAQVSLAFFLKIPEQFPGFVMISAAFADLFLVLAVMAQVGRWERSRSKRGEEKG